MKVRDHLFTLDEANTLIPRLGQWLARIQEKRQIYSRRHDILFLHELLTQAEGKTHPSDEEPEQFLEEVHELEEAVTKLREDIQQIHNLGCIVRNLEDGWVEFRAEIEGEAVFYSWKMGESEIRYYRSAREDVRDRKPLRSAA